LFWFLFSSEKENKLIELEKSKHHNSFIAYAKNGFSQIVNDLKHSEGLELEKDQNLN